MQEKKNPLLHFRQKMHLCVVQVGQFIAVLDRTGDNADEKDEETENKPNTRTPVIRINDGKSSGKLLQKLQSYTMLNRKS